MTVEITNFHGDENILIKVPECSRPFFTIC